NKEGGVFTAYDERLGQALAAQIAVAILRAQLMDHYVQKKQWEHGMDLAREIQQSLWPKAAPAVPGYDIAGWSRPADTTGGDCFDYVPLPGGRWAIVLADASGHGIGSALVIAETRALLRALSGSAESPEALLERVNSFLFADLTDGRFVTALYGVLDPDQHTFEYASAGQAPLFWYRARERRVEATGCTGLPLAVLHPTVFDPAPRVELAPGDFGVFLTDGFAEAHRPQGPLLGEERLMAALQKHAHRPARELITVLEEEVQEHLGALSAPDDLTAVVVKRVG